MENGKGDPPQLEDYDGIKAEIEQRKGRWKLANRRARDRKDEDRGRLWEDFEELSLKDKVHKVAKTTLETSRMWEDTLESADGITTRNSTLKEKWSRQWQDKQLREHRTPAEMTQLLEKAEVADDRLDRMLTTTNPKEKWSLRRQS
jgi:hypothetical protein